MTIRELPGHKNLRTTMIHAHAAKKNILGVESRKTERHKIVPVMLHVLKTPMPQHQMHDQHRDNHAMTHRQMIKTGAEPRLDVRLQKQFLNDHRPGEGRKFLLHKTKRRKKKHRNWWKIPLDAKK